MAGIETPSTAASGAHASLMSAAAILFGTELGFFQRILDTEELSGNPWI